MIISDELLEKIEKLPKEKQKVFLELIYYRTFMEWLNDNKM